MNTNKFYIFVADWCPFCRSAKEAIFMLVDKYGKNNNIVLIEDSSEEFKTMGPKLNALAFPAFIIADENDKELARHEGDRSFLGLLRFYITNTDSTILEEDVESYSK
jgi:thiol-disulfide isomerase/thioredoxin